MVFPQQFTGKIKQIHTFFINELLKLLFSVYIELDYELGKTNMLDLRLMMVNRI